MKPTKSLLHWSAGLRPGVFRVASHFVPGRRPALLALALALPVLCDAAQLTVTAVNKLPIARASLTIELSAKQLEPITKDLGTVHVKDSTGKELIVQAVDTDADAYRKHDIVIFQADFAANETKNFTITTGAKQVYTREQYKAFGRFVHSVMKHKDRQDDS